VERSAVRVEETLERARALHRAHPVVELHCDFALDVWDRRRRGERGSLRDVYLPRLRRGGVRVQFLTVGGDMPVTTDRHGRPDRRARDMIHALVAEIEEADGAQLVESANDLEDVLVGDAIGVVMHLEGCSPLRGRDDALDEFYALGVRSLGLTWNERNEVGDGVMVEGADGLTPWGCALVEEIGRRGMVLDVSHLAPPGVRDALGHAVGPVVATHANCASVWEHCRNLSDDEIRAIAASGGLVGVCFFPPFLREPSLDAVLDHVDRLVEVAGIEAVGVGPDYVDFAPELILSDLHWPPDGSAPRYPPSLRFPEGLADVATLPTLTAGLLARGYEEPEIAAILGGNGLRLLRSVLRSPDCREPRART
jgi:membrane dipeptidase